MTRQAAPGGSLCCWRGVAGLCGGAVVMAMLRGGDGTTGWRSRGYLPHFDAPGLIQSVTFRLHDSVPVHCVQQWRNEIEAAPCTDHSPLHSSRELRRRIARYEDAGHGACHLRDPRVAAAVQDSLLHFDPARYRLLAWCIMPNHVHVLVELQADRRLADVVHTWKSFTASRANRILGRKGDFWKREYHDRFIRNGEHYLRTKVYIESNPVVAGLARTPGEWAWSSACRRADLK